MRCLCGVSCSLTLKAQCSVPFFFTCTCPHLATSSVTEIKWRTSSLVPALSFKSHVNHATKTFFFHLRSIGGAETPPLQLLKHASNIRLHHFQTRLLQQYPLQPSFHCPPKKLQFVENSAAQLLTHSHSREYISPIIHQHLWLPVG